MGRKWLCLIILLCLGCSEKPEGYDTAVEWQAWMCDQVRYVDHGEWRIRELHEQLVRGGDCDDQALALLKILEYEGLDVEFDEGMYHGDAHGWVLWKSPSGVWVLDPSQRRYPERRENLWEYKPYR